MCCQQFAVISKRKGKATAENVSAWILPVLSAVALQAVLVSCENPKQVGGVGGSIVPPILLPLQRNKPPTLPCMAKKQLSPGEEFFIESPDFRKQKYPNSAYCEWQFAANRCSMGVNCPDFQLAEFLCFDHLDIVDSNGTMSRYCGKKGPKETVLSDNVTISFTSSWWFPDQGFRCRVVCRETTNEEDHSPFPKLEANTTKCNCGKPVDVKIINGKPTTISHFPWQAGLVRKGGSTPFCSGSLINDRYLLTAAHCVQGRTPYNLEIIFNVTEYGKAEETEIRRTVENILVHKKFSSRLDYDAALVRLSEPVDISGEEGASIIPVCLPSGLDENKTYAKSNATVTGWGQTSEGGQLSPVLQEANVEVISNSECSNYYPSVTERMLCAHTPGKDACQGDSGGPLLVVKGDVNDPVQFLENANMHQHYVQIGIVSWGQGCGVKPGVYTRVTELIKWINTNARDGSYCNGSKTSMAY